MLFFSAWTTRTSGKGEDCHSRWELRIAAIGDFPAARNLWLVVTNGNFAQLPGVQNPIEEGRDRTVPIPLVQRLHIEVKMKSMRSHGARGRSNRSLLRWIVGAACLGAISSEGLNAQTPATLPPMAIPSGLPVPLPLPASSPLPSTASLPKTAVIPSLPTMPPQLSRIPQEQVGAPTGAVQVRLGSSSGDSPEPSRMPSHTVGRSPASTVSIAVDPIQLRSEAPISSGSTPASPVATQSTGKGPVKFSLGDEGAVDLGVQRTFQPPTLVQRTPELVRPKKYSVSQVVTVAADANLSEEPSKSSSTQTATLEVSRPVAPTLPNFVPAPTPPEPASTLSLPNPTSPTPSRIALEQSPAASKFPSSPVAVATQTPVATPSPLSGMAVERTYDIEVLGTYSLDPATPVASVIARDPETCSVFHNGRMITVVGNKVGSTAIEIRGTDQSVRAVGVKVLPTGRLHAAPSTELDKVKAMIAQHFPTAKLGFVQEPEGGIVIKGTVSSEGDARRILELVRKLCLVPIKDQIKVAY